MLRKIKFLFLIPVIFSIACMNENDTKKNTNNTLKKVIIKSSGQYDIQNTYEFSNTQELVKTEYKSSKTFVPDTVSNYEYNNDGSIKTLKKTIIVTGDTEIKSYNYINEYNEYGTIVAKKVIVSDGSEKNIYYGYDEDGKLSALAEQDKSGNVLVKAVQ